jgi:hypothetical protein
VPSIRYGRHTPASSTIDESLVTRQRDSRGGGEEALLFLKLFVELKAGAVRPYRRRRQVDYPTSSSVNLSYNSDRRWEVVLVAAGLLSFPHPVNEVSARLVAGGVVIMCAVAISLDQRWLIAVIAYGFVARVLTGPTLSPLGQLVTRVITPLLGVAARPVPGPPKRFAQGIGAVLSLTAAVLAFWFHMPVAAYAVLGVIAVAATLEAVFALCLGCAIFAGLMRVGVIPEAICQECNDIRNRTQAAARGA